MGSEKSFPHPLNPSFIRMNLIRSLLFLASLPMAASPALLTHEFIYEKAPYPSCHASTIVESAQGGLVAA